MRHDFSKILTLYHIAINLEISDFKMSNKFLDPSIASHEVLLYNKSSTFWVWYTLYPNSVWFLTDFGNNFRAGVNKNEHTLEKSINQICTDIAFEEKLTTEK